MKFSVLMSLYAKEKAEYLQECLTSLTQQTLLADEIVLVFDGEIGDDLQQVVNAFSDKLPFKFVKLEKNVGLGKALNAGLEQCSHDWVFRMDTDDICMPERFAKQVAFIKDNPNIVLFGGQILEFETDINHAHIKSVPVNHDEILAFAKKRNPFNHMTVAFKKDVIVKLGGYQHHLFMEDYNLWLRVIGQGYLVANVQDVLVYARVGNGMHARRRGLEYIKSEKQLLNLKLDLKIQSFFSALLIFLVRVSVRLLPTEWLKKFYGIFLRNDAIK